MEEKNLIWDSVDSIDQLRLLLQQDQVVMGSSDTVFGLLANVTESGFLKLNEIKGRTVKPYIVLIENVDKLNYFAEMDLSDSVLRLLTFCWPGPLTVILPAKMGLPKFIQSVDQKIALRVPQHAGLLALLHDFNGLFSTSANLAGEPVPNLLADVSPAVIEKVAAIVLDRHGIDHANTSLPSTILDYSDGVLRLVRAGAYGLDSLERIYGGKILS